MTTGTGELRIQNGGVITVNGGLFHVNAEEVMIDGGQLHRPAGQITPAADQQWTVTNGGTLDAYSFDIDNGMVVTVSSGSTYATTVGTDIGETLDGGDATFIVEGTDSSATMGSTSEWAARDGATVQVEVRDDATAEVNNVRIGTLGSGTTVVQVSSGGQLTVTGDLDIYSTGPTAGSTALTVTGADSVFSATSGDIMVFGDADDASYALNVLDGGTFAKNSGSIRLFTDGIIHVDDGTFVFDQLVDYGGTLTWVSGTLHDTSDLVLTNADTLLDVAHNLTSGKTLIVDGTTTVDDTTLLVDGGSLETTTLAVVNGGSFVWVRGNVTLTGGTTALDLAVPSLGQLSGSGAVTGRVTAAANSTISASGTLALGDAAAANGFYCNGTLNLNDQTVTLVDANDAVLDSGALVELGSAGTGTLAAANGLTLDFGGNITGYGTVDTPDDPTTPLVNNGHIVGNGPAEPITLTGYVKGVGTLDNVVITGTDAPGFSPAAVVRGSVTYDGVLEIEIGGLTPGSQFDQVNHILGAGAAELGGTLDVLLTGGFMPTVGDSFEFLTAIGGVSGTFDAELLPALTGDLAWNVLYDANSVSLVVALPGDYNGDGTVDAADYTVWRDSLGDTVPKGAGADGNSDGQITEADYTVWKLHFGATAASGSGATGSASAARVPEPASLLLALVGGIMISAFRRRQVSHR